MTAGAHVFSSNYPAAIERAREAQGLSRKAGVYFDYFVASLYLNWAVLLRGDLGGSLQICRDGIELATRNGSSFPLLWFNVRTAWARMEAFDFAGPLEICERYAAHPVLAANRSTFVPLYLWLGLARMGSGDLDGAWAAFETLREAVEGGGIPFQCVCPLLRAQCECALARGDRMLAKSLAERLRKTAEEHGERVFLAEAHRLLAQVQETGGDFRGAEDHVARAMAAIERSEAWTAERRICAAAARIFGEMGRREESTAFRERARRASGRL
jgi:ATP/maltotriose-dependent transcriptional regulator MalT